MCWSMAVFRLQEFLSTARGGERLTLAEKALILLTRRILLADKTLGKAMLVPRYWSLSKIWRTREGGRLSVANMREGKAVYVSEGQGSSVLLDLMSLC